MKGCDIDTQNRAVNKMPQNSARIYGLFYKKLEEMYDMVIIMRRTLLGRLAFILFAAVLVIILSNGSNANASNNSLAQKPYMGWSTYSMKVYSGNGYNWITEAQIKA
jgi:hypothetical protein